MGLGLQMPWTRDSSVLGLAWDTGMTTVSFRLATALSHTGLSPQAPTCPFYQYTDVPLLTVGILFSDLRGMGFLDHSISPYFLVTAQVKTQGVATFP